VTAIWGQSPKKGEDRSAVCVPGKEGLEFLIGKKKGGASSGSSKLPVFSWGPKEGKGRVSGCSKREVTSFVLDGIRRFHSSAEKRRGGLWWGGEKPKKNSGVPAVASEKGKGNFLPQGKKKRKIVLYVWEKEGKTAPSPGQHKLSETERKERDPHLKGNVSSQVKKEREEPPPFLFQNPPSPE